MALGRNILMDPLGWYKGVWNAYRSKFFAVVLTVLITIGIGVLPILPIILVVTAYFMGDAGVAGAFAGSFGLYLIVLFIFGILLTAVSLGYVFAFKILAFRGILRGKPDLVSSSKDALKHTPAMLSLLILYGIYILFSILVLFGGTFFLSYAVATSSAFLAVVFTLALVLFVLFASWVFVRSMWAPVYLVSDGLGVLGALRKSWTVTGIRLGEAVVGGLSLVAVSIASGFVANVPLVGSIFVFFFFDPLWDLLFVAVAEDLGNKSTA